jgi:hypothetical protein
MRQFATILIGLLLAIALWYGAWRWMMAGDVARVETSINYQNQAIKTVDRDMVLKSDGVSATGFPFHFRVKVKRLTLSTIDQQRTYAVSLPEVTLVPTDSEQGRYRVELPASFDALYAENGAAPENYRVSVQPIPQVAVRAQGDSTQCSPFPGQTHCAAVAADAPIISYATELPATITLHMELNGESRDAAFQLVPVSVPIFQTIPKELVNPLELFVGVLREALVFKTK